MAPLEQHLRIVRHDGTAKNDGERNAAKRFIAKLRQDHPHLKCIVWEEKYPVPSRATQ